MIKLKLVLCALLIVVSTFAQTPPNPVLDGLIQGTEARRLMLENQRIEQEIRSRRAADARAEMRESALQATPPPMAVEQWSSDWYTNESLNGRGWKGHSAYMRLTYPHGFLDALRVGEAAKSYHLYANSNNTFGGLIALVDQFYLDPANILIPASLALQLVNLRIGGLEPDEFDKLTAGARRQALAMFEKPVPEPTAAPVVKHRAETPYVPLVNPNTDGPGGSPVFTPAMKNP